MIREQLGVDVNDWANLHTAAAAVDRARRMPAGIRPLGGDVISDAFGGTYSPIAWECDGFAGAVRLLGAAHKIRDAAWDAIHGAHLRADRKLAIEVARTGVRTALALHRLYTLLHEIGVVAYRPDHVICGVTSTVQVTGLRWLAGDKIDSTDLMIPRAAAEAFAAGGSVELLAEARA